jgi:hypothetical protein
VDNLHELSCGDGGCVYGTAGGMHTNGGCRCMSGDKHSHGDGSMQDNFRKARKAIYFLRAQIKDFKKQEVAYKEQIDLLELDISVSHEMIGEEMDTSTAIYEGNMRKKKKLRERITTLEKELAAKIKSSDGLVEAATGYMRQVTEGIRREKKLELEVLSLLGQLQDRTELTNEITALKARYKEADKDRTRIGTLLSGEMMKHYRPIEFGFQHDRVLKRIEAIWQAEPGTPEYSELEVLATIVCCYERKVWPNKPPTHADILAFCKDQGMDVDKYYEITRVKYEVTKVDKDE